PQELPPFPTRRSSDLAERSGEGWEIQGRQIEGRPGQERTVEGRPVQERSVQGRPGKGPARRPADAAVGPERRPARPGAAGPDRRDRKSTRLNSSHVAI